MAKKTYGEKTIERLKGGGYSTRAIEDITYLAERHRTKIGNAERMLSQGYTPATVNEIYGVAREFSQDPRRVQRFYDRFKQAGSLPKLVKRLSDLVKYSNSDIELHKAIVFAVNDSYKYDGDFDKTLANLEGDFAEAQFYAKGLNEFCEFGEYPEEEEPAEEPFEDEIGRTMRNEVRPLWGFR